MFFDTGAPKRNQNRGKSETSPSFQINKIDNGLIFYTHYYGTILLETLIQSSETRTRDPLYDNAVFIVMDWENADVSKLTAEDVKTMSARVRSVLQVRPYLVIIMVADAPLAYGLSRIWYGVTKNASNNLHIVGSENAAFEIINRIRSKRKI